MNEFETQKKNIKEDPSFLETAMRMAGTDPSNHKAIRCPWHDDHDPSANIYQGDDDAYRFHCFVCNVTYDYYDVMARIKGVDVDEFMSEQAKAFAANGDRGGGGGGAKKNEKKEVRVFEKVEDVAASFGESYVEHYLYTNPASKLIDLMVVRWLKPDGKKSFFQAHQKDINGPLYGEKPKGKQPLYNRSRVQLATNVIVVEGEKDVHSLFRIGYTATTSPGGSGSAEHADWSPLAGKHVIIWPDNDTPGKKHAEAVKRLLGEVDPPPTVSIIDADSLGIPEKADATWIIEQAGNEREDKVRAVRDVLDSAQSTGASRELRLRLEEIVSGKRKAIPFIHHETSRLTQALLPQTITIVCGSPGASKSLWVQEALMEMSFQGIKIALLHIEDDRTYHLRRALAQLALNSDVTIEEYVAKNAYEILTLEEEFRDRLDLFGACITDVPGQTITYDQVVTWCRKKSEIGGRVLAIDPITLADPGSKKPWEADRELMSALKAVSVEYRNSILLVTHPGKSGGKDTQPLDKMSGGAAFQRAAQCVMWLDHHAEPITDAKIMVGGQAYSPDKSRPLNRTLRLLKTRNGKGQGSDIGFFFNPKTLRSHELGVIIQEPKRKR